MLCFECVCVCQTEMSYRSRDYKPKENLRLDIRTNQDGLVALSATDSALFTLRPNYRDPVAMVTQKTSRCLCFPPDTVSLSTLYLKWCETSASCSVTGRTVACRFCVTSSKATRAAVEAAAETAQTSSDWPASPSPPTPTPNHQPAVRQSISQRHTPGG